MTEGLHKGLILGLLVATTAQKRPASPLPPSKSVPKTLSRNDPGSQRPCPSARIKFSRAHTPHFEKWDWVPMALTGSQQLCLLSPSPACNARFLLFLLNFRTLVSADFCPVRYNWDEISLLLKITARTMLMTGEDFQPIPKMVCSCHNIPS